MLKYVKMGLGYLVDKNNRPIKRTREQAERLAKKKAKERSKLDKILWSGVVFEAEEYYRINLGR